MSPARRRSKILGDKPKKGQVFKRKLPKCRCLSCQEMFEQPDLHYINLDCPKCLKRKGKKRWKPAPT